MSKQFYSKANLKDTYEDLAELFDVKVNIIVSHLNKKGRVPAGVLKDYKPKYVEQPRCIARNLTTRCQCGNESMQGKDDYFCKVHLIHPPRYTINQTEEEISELENIREQKEKKKKEKKKKTKKTKQTKKKSEESSEDSYGDRSEKEDNMDIDNN